jgi:hypothetical protein
MTDYMLRTDTEAQMDDALEAAGILADQDVGGGEMILMPVAGCYVDRIGPIKNDTRFHANIRVTFALTPEQIEALPTFTPEPGIPYRVFA